MEHALWILGLVIVLLGAVVGWCFHAAPDVHAPSIRSFLAGLFGLPAAVGLAVLLAVLYAFSCWRG